MKIIFLNTLDAEIAEPLRAFLLAHAPDTDVFCFQECYDAMQRLLVEISADFTELVANKFITSQNEPFTNITLVRKTLAVKSSSSNIDAEGTGLNLFSTIRYKDKEVHIANIHGLSKPGKLDNEDRLRQSQEFIDAFAPLKGVKIIGGDLNVLLDTKSVALFEEAGYHNLIKDFGIKTTRNKIAWAKHPDKELYHSDYVFINGTEVVSFVVPVEIVSDHQPMILTINIQGV